MRKLILLFSLLVSSLAFGQEEVPYELLGVWMNGEGEALVITRQDSNIVFQRRTSTKIEATGTIEMIDGDLLVKRYDVEDTYKLELFIGNVTMVIHKPYSTQAWLWSRVQ